VGRLDGATWTQLKSADSEFLFYGLHGTPTRLFAVGSQGAAMVTQ
jgi:hypothetical protein